MRMSPLALYAILSMFKVANSQTEFKGCSVPSFEWAAYSRRTSARMYGMRGALAGDNLFAAGFVKSTIDGEATTAIDKDFALTGPYSVADPKGLDATTIEIDLTSYPASAGAKENAGGSFGQYEIGVAKIHATTGEPRDFFVYSGFGLDETSGLAAKDDAIAISGHFTGNLTAVLADGTSKTIWNSNIEVGGVPDQSDQFHPNQKDASAHTGNDDGFVIKASGISGIADWIVHYPESNKDSQVIAVDIDDDGNVFGSGYKCTQAQDAAKKVCDGVVAMMNSNDGTIMWEKILPDLGAVFRIKHDSEDGALYVTGTTTYGGSAKDGKVHPHCLHDTCAVVLRLAASDGEVQWVRTVKGSPRWGVFDQSGGVEIATADDGPNIYVAIDDTAEESKDGNSAVSLDAGTPYAGCMLTDGSFTPEFDIVQDRVLTKSDCVNSEFIARDDSRAMVASEAATSARCGKDKGGDACLMKYHKHTGLPIWATDVPPVAGLVPSSDGASVHIAGWYYPGRSLPFFDDVLLPGYLRVGGLGSQTSGVFNAKIDATTGTGEYVVHSGGGSKDRLYDVVGDLEGNIYNIGYSMNLVMNWGGTLKTTIVEDDVDAADAGFEAIETHMYTSKLAAATEAIPPCLTECTGNTDTAVISTNSCFIDGKCYNAGDSGAAFGKSCFVCDPSVNQRAWEQGPSFGTTQCYVDGSCVDHGDTLFYQRRTWSKKLFSECQVCNATEDATEWSLKAGFLVDTSENPPDDCTIDNNETDTSGDGDGGSSTDGDGGGGTGTGGGGGTGTGGDGVGVSGTDDKIDPDDNDLDEPKSSTNAGILWGNVHCMGWLMCIMLITNVY